jgi:hypothetical protein
MSAESLDDGLEWPQTCYNMLNCLYFSQNHRIYELRPSYLSPVILSGIHHSHKPLESASMPFIHKWPYILC